MNQDDVFIDSEGDNWFKRNRKAVLDARRFDWPLELISMIKNKDAIRSVLELGCSNGWRLNRIRKLRKGMTLHGIDASTLAIADGRKRYKGLILSPGSLSDIPLQTSFDLVIVNFVFHWVSRETLARSIAEVDRVVGNKGILIIGDFLPDFPQKRRYHHLPESEVYTYKQDYARIFESLGTYREVRRITYNHDDPDHALMMYDTSVRGYCSVLYKSFDDYYFAL